MSLRGGVRLRMPDALKPRREEGQLYHRKSDSVYITPRASRERVSAFWVSLGGRTGRTSSRQCLETLPCREEKRRIEPVLFLPLLHCAVFTLRVFP